MPRIILNVSDGQKALWVDRAYEERCSLAEWIRRRCDAGLTAGVPGTAPLVEVRAKGSPPSSVPAVSLDVVAPDRAQGAAPGKASFRPDPKGAVTREKEARLAPSGSACPADTPKGVRCKLCGKEH